MALLNGDLGISITGVMFIAGFGSFVQAGLSTAKEFVEAGNVKRIKQGTF